MKTTGKTIIVGGGWAGLAAAIELSRHRYPVQVLESAKQLGGRARRIAFDKDTLDNGQHLMIGAYRETLGLLKVIGLEADQILQRQSLDWLVATPHGKTTRVQAYTAPAPFHLLLGLLTAQGLRWHDKYRALALGHQLWKGSSIADSDLDVLTWLQQHKQTQKLIDDFWEPLCLATLNTPLNEASAKCFVRVLSQAFLDSVTASHYLMPRQDLSSTFVDPAMTYIEKNGGNIILAHRVDKLLLKDKKIIGVQCQDKSIDADQVILSTPPNITANLTADIPALTHLTRQLNQFSFQPICTIYLRYPEDIRLPSATPIMGMSNTISQWVFDRNVCQQPGVIAVVISSRGPHMQMDNKELIEQVAQELASCFPLWPKHRSAKVIREKRATFACEVGIDSIRPESETAITGLYLAGDYTNTGYPATLEGAVLSGICAAQNIIKQH